MSTFKINSSFGSICCIVAASLMQACTATEEDVNTREKSMKVQVTAYNALPSQTTAIDPEVAAWGDTLKTGMKAIAVSRDLIPLGLRRGTSVRIEGLEGEYLVLDKMNRRYSRRIDLFMDKDVKAARNWGRQGRCIYWDVDVGSPEDARYEPDSNACLHMP